MKPPVDGFKKSDIMGYQAHLKSAGMESSVKNVTVIQRIPIPTTKSSGSRQQSTNYSKGFWPGPRREQHDERSARTGHSKLSSASAIKKLSNSLKPLDVILKRPRLDTSPVQRIKSKEMCDNMECGDYLRQEVMQEGEEVSTKDFSIYLRNYAMVCLSKVVC